MNDFKESLKVNIEPEKENKNVELIKMYINKEKEIAKQFDKEDGIDVEAEDYEPKATATLMRIKNFLSYRELRTKQAYTAKMSKGNKDRAVMERLAKFDKDRREKHNLALTSLNGLVDFAERFNLEPIYTGKRLSEKEIKEHKADSYDTRLEMTDAFLQILIDLGNYSTRECSDKSLKKDLESIKDQMYKFSKDYGVTKELSYDDGDISFEDLENEI